MDSGQADSKNIKETHWMKTFQLPIDKIIIQLGYKSSGKLFMSNQFQNAPLSPQSKRILKEIKGRFEID